MLKFIIDNQETICRWVSAGMLGGDEKQRPEWPLFVSWGLGALDGDLDDSSLLRVL